MSERFTKLLSIPRDLYTEGAPLLIAAGNLLKENKANEVLVQLKLRNISSKAITAVRVLVRCRDAFGNKLDGDTIYDYLDMSVSRDWEFGQRQAIHLPHNNARAVDVQIVLVRFADGSLWEAQAPEWISLKPQETAESVLGDHELVKQYRISRGAEAKYMPLRDRDLWLCSCGRVNHLNEAACHACGHKETVDLEALKRDRDARLVQERIEAQLEAEKRAARAKRNRKIAIISAAAALVVAGALLLTFLVFIPNAHYKSALALKDAGEFEQAIEAFEAMEGYRDSEDQIELCKEGIENRKKAEAYAAAEQLLADKDYDAAIKAFEELGDFSDSRDRIEDVHNAIKQDAYDAAAALLEEGRLDEAEAAFTELGDFGDSKARLDDVADARKALAYADAEALLQAEKYDKAEAAFAELGDFRDAPKRVEEVQAARTQSVYLRAKDLQAAGKYESALNDFETLGDYSDSAERIRQCAAALAAEAAAKGQTEKAANWYLKAGDTKNAYPLMYQYVTANLDSTNKTTYNFLSELKKADYEDAVSLYDRLYMLLGKFIFNTSTNDNRTSVTQIDSTKANPKSAYFHGIINGPPGEPVQIRVVHEIREGSSDAQLGDWSTSQDFTLDINYNDWFNKKMPENKSAVCYHRFSFYVGTELVSTVTLKTTYK